MTIQEIREERKEMKKFFGKDISKDIDKLFLEIGSFAEEKLIGFQEKFNMSIKERYEIHIHILKALYLSSQKARRLVTEQDFIGQYIGEIYKC